MHSPTLQPRPFPFRGLSLQRPREADGAGGRGARPGAAAPGAAGALRGRQRPGEAPRGSAAPGRDVGSQEWPGEKWWWRKKQEKRMGDEYRRPSFF